MKYYSQFVFIVFVFFNFFEEMNSYLWSQKVPTTDEIFNQTIGHIYGITKKKVGDKSFYYGNSPSPTKEEVKFSPVKTYQNVKNAQRFDQEESERIKEDCNNFTI